MSITVGAALKKIAVALLSDKKTLKKAAMAILVVIVALFMPMAAIITVFSGTLKLDVGALQEQIAEEMSDGDWQMLQQVEDNMNAIQTALRTRICPAVSGKLRCCISLPCMTIPTNRDLCPGWSAAFSRSRRMTS